MSQHKTYKTAVTTSASTAQEVFSPASKFTAYNIGSEPMIIKWGSTNAVAASATYTSDVLPDGNVYIPAGGAVKGDKSIGDNFYSAITESGTTSVVIVLGDVESLSVGGIGGGGGGGTPITLPETGATPFFDSDGDNTAQALKASAGVLFKLHVSNSNAADAYVQLFDLAAGSVTVGTTTPDYVLLVPANGGVIDDYVLGMNFAAAITYACTTTPTGNGDPTTGLTVSATYQ